MIELSRKLLLVLLFLVSYQAYASSPLTEHTLAVSQSMSAFYMFALTDGDKRYEEEYKHYFSVADQHLKTYQQQEAQFAGELKFKWDKLREFLAFEYVEDAGYIVSSQMRMQYRQYLNALYGKLSSSINSETNFQEQLILILLDVEIMSARFFDISSSVTGPMNLSSNDLIIDPPAMAKVLAVKLQKLIKSSATKPISKNLKLVNRKWQFIEDSVINYKEQSAYLLVYYNKGQISKLINKSRNVMAGT